jgi:hypothetical protein
VDFSISALGASPMSYLAASSPTAAPDSGGSGGIDDASIGPAATLEISSLQLQGQMMSTLLAGLNGGSPTSLLPGLPGSSAAPAGSVIDLLA